MIFLLINIYNKKLFNPMNKKWIKINIKDPKVIINESETIINCFHNINRIQSVIINIKTIIKIINR